VEGTLPIDEESCIQQVKVIWISDLERDWQ
jgi:hypothetical protein